LRLRLTGIFCCAVLCLLVPAESVMAAAAAQPSVILITVDTVRADRMGFLGSHRGLTPNLDALAQDSVVFNRAYSQVPLTNPSHATILTGTYPQFHRVNDFAIPLTSDLPDLPEILHAHGYSTAAFVGSSILDPKGTAPGFDRGFDIYDAKTGERRSGSAVIELALTWLKPRSSDPFFLWVHLYDPHAPYDPPEPFRSRYPAEPYDATIAYADSVLGSFLTQLRTMGLYDRTLIAFMSDHGEALGQHGEREHGYFLYDETIHVPLLVKFPEGHFSGTRVEASAGLVDVAPTILQIVGLLVPATMQGQSLLPLLKLHSTKASADTNETLSDRQIFSETDYPYLTFGWSPLRALRSNQYLFIDAPRKELYDQPVDSVAERNKAASSPAVTDTMKALLDAFRSGTVNSSPASKSVLDAQQAKKLNALGYVAFGEASANSGKDPARTDPKDKIEVANEVTEALRDMSRGRYEDALPLLRYALAQESGSPAVYQMFGESCIHLHYYKDAVAPLRKALQLGSDRLMVHYQLGLALFETEDWKGAETEFSAASAQSPRWPDAHYWLGSTYSRMKRYPEAEKELTASLEFEPNNFAANMELGQVFLIEHNPEKAIAIFQKAAKLEPRLGDPHHFLARAYSALGQEEDARRENAEAVDLTQPGNHKWR
jgi:arylsulfatase A-like enzyme/Tfp pilus assembly protein PilF